MNTCKVSLVLATVGRTDELCRLIDSLVRQTFRNFEVILVDQNLDDRLQSHVQRLDDVGMALKHVKHFPPNLSTARNAGIALAQGKWVGFPDDDCWYDAQFLEHLCPYFDDTTALSGVSARWVELIDSNVRQTDLTCKRSRAFRDVPTTSFTLFFNRKLFDEIGAFDARLGVGQWFGAAEETDLVLRALGAGAKIAYEPSAKVYHPLKRPQPTPQARLSARSRARGTGALYKKHNLSFLVVVRGLLAPLGRSLLRSRRWGEWAHGYAVSLGRMEGMMRWGSAMHDKSVRLDVARTTMILRARGARQLVHQKAPIEEERKAAA